VEPKFNVAHDYMQTQVGASKQQGLRVLLLYCCASCLQNHAHAAQLTYTIAKLRQAEAVMLTCTYAYAYVQCEINEKMRNILVDWLVEVHLKFKVSSIEVDLALTATTLRQTTSSQLQQHQAGYSCSKLFNSIGQHPPHTSSSQHALLWHVSYAVTVFQC
jgi:hypothetical protein